MDNMNVGGRLRYFLLSLLSRKFLLAVAGTFIAFDAALTDGVVTQSELIMALSPILAFLGVEGIGDIAERAKK